MIGYREYGTKATVVVHTDTGVEKVEGDVPATKAQGK